MVGHSKVSTFMASIVNSVLHFSSDISEYEAPKKKPKILARLPGASANSGSVSGRTPLLPVGGVFVFVPLSLLAVRIGRVF